jgi:hypothetical protein
MISNWPSSKPFYNKKIPTHTKTKKKKENKKKKNREQYPWHVCVCAEIRLRSEGGTSTSRSSIHFKMRGWFKISMMVIRVSWHFKNETIKIPKKKKKKKMRYLIKHSSKDVKNFRVKRPAYGSEGNIFGNHRLNKLMDPSILKRIVLNNQLKQTLQFRFLKEN